MTDHAKELERLITSLKHVPGGDITLEGIELLDDVLTELRRLQDEVLRLANER